MTVLLIIYQFCIINLHYQIWLTRLKVSSTCDCECSCFRSVAAQKSDSRCFFIADVLKLSKAVEWFIILLQILHEILNNSSTIEVNCIKWFHISDCLSSVIFLNQSELFIFFWVLFWILLTTEIWDHHCRKELFVFKVYWTYSLFSLSLSCEKFYWILLIASCLVFIFSEWCEEFIDHWTWLAKSSEWRLSEDKLCETLLSDRLKVVNELDIL